MKKVLRRDAVIASAIFLLALTVRLTFIWQWNATPYGALPIGDSHAYDLWAQDIVHGQFFSVKAFYQPPLYPYVLALLYKIFGHSFVAASLFNALLDALSCAILSVIALDCFGFEAAILTGALAALDRQLIFYTAPLMKESLGFFLIVLFLASVLRALDVSSALTQPGQSGKIRHFFLSGALLGVLALVRGNALLLVPAILLLAYIKRGRQSLRDCAAFALATLMVLLPATIHNAVVSHDFVLINYDGGFNLYRGNSPSATGTTAAVPEEAAGVMRETTFDEEEGTTDFAEQVRGHPLRPSEVSAFWRNKAFDFIVQNPRQSLHLLLGKLCLFWNSGSLPDNYTYNIAFITENFPTLLSLPLPGLWFVSVAAAFALAGFWCSFPPRFCVIMRGRENEAVATFTILAGIYMLSVLPFCVSDRLRLPIEAFLLPLAGAAWPCARELVRCKRWGRLVVAMTFAALFLAIGLHPGPSPHTKHGPRDTAYNYGILSSLSIDLGHYRDALTWARKGAEAGGTDAQTDLGLLYYKGESVPQDYAQAMQWFRKAAEQGNANAQYNLGNMYYEGNGVPQDYTQAKQWFRAAAEGGALIAQNNLGVMYYQGQGAPQDYAQAMQWFRKAAEAGNANAQNNLGNMYYTGNGAPRDTQQAAQWFRKAAAQGNAEAHHNL